VDIVGVPAEPVQNYGLMDVDGDEPPGVHLHHLDHDLGAQRLSPLEPLVLPGVTEVRHHCADLLRSQAQGRVLKEKELDQVVVGVSALNDDDIIIDPLLLDPHIAFPVREAGGVGLQVLALQLLRQVLGKHLRGRTADYNHTEGIGVFALNPTPSILLFSCTYGRPDAMQWRDVNGQHRSSPSIGPVDAWKKPPSESGSLMHLAYSEALSTRYRNHVTIYLMRASNVFLGCTWKPRRTVRPRSLVSRPLSLFLVGHM